MEYSKIFDSQSFGTVIPDFINNELKNILIREDRQEDLLFALWTPSVGNKRYTAVINEIIFPEDGDRNIHGNASYNYQYLLRVCKIAMKKEMGVTLLHSHPFPGWQNMSFDDIETEKKTFVNAFSTTGLPFVGLTVGDDGYWSSRVWYYKDEKICKKWSHSVRITGPYFHIYFNDNLIPPEKPNNKTIRTVNVWGEETHKNITRLKIGIVGLGSVGSVVAEMLARMGISDFTLIDYDEVKEHNLDRLAGAFYSDIGSKKVKVIKNHILKAGTANKISVKVSENKLSKEDAYRKALDCDIIFSCVDKPWGRYILNHFAFSHLIPIIDGGILIEFGESGDLNFADWTVHTIVPGKPCLSCLKAFNTSDVELEKDGLLDDPKYLSGLPDNHYLKSRENISAFSYNLASMEVIHFMALVADVVDPMNYGEQKFRFKHGFLSRNYDVKCDSKCDYSNTIGMADKLFELFEK
jgi:hypothetical protein